MIKAIIFDLEGTLVDSADAVLGAFKHVAASIAVPYDEAFVRASIGLRLEDTYRRLASGHDVDKLAATHRTWQHDNKQLFKTFENLDVPISHLKKRGLKLGVYTSAVRSRTELVLDVLHMRDYFDAIVCGDEVQKPKPDKQGVEQGAKLLKAKLNEVVFVGDAEHDILSGKNAGVVTIG